MASLISVGQVFDHSLEHVRRHFKELLALVLWMVAAAIPSIVGKLLAPTGGDINLNAGDWLTLGLSLFGAILTAVVSIWATASLIILVANQVNRQKYQMKQVYAQGWKLFFPYLGLAITLSAIVIGIAALCVPGLILLILVDSTSSATATALGVAGLPLFLAGALAAILLLVKYSIHIAFAPYFLILEGAGIFKSIGLSSDLVKGRWWSTAARYVLPKLVYFLVLFIISFVSFYALEILMALSSTSSSLMTLLFYTLSLFLSILLSVVLTPLIIVTDYYLYTSLKETR